MSIHLGGGHGAVSTGRGEALHDLTVTTQADRMEVRAWSNGRPLRTGAGYGVRLSANDRDKHFALGRLGLCRRHAAGGDGTVNGRLT